VYKEFLWGGRRISRLYSRSMPSGVCAESWEISDRGEGMSVVSNGALAGMTLRGLLKKFGKGLLGRDGGIRSFPLLVKILDANKRLSLQVHPARKARTPSGGEPKTEMWYVLWADDKAKVFAGLKKGVGRDAFLNALRDNRIEDVLNVVAIRTGDAVFVPGGMLHAIDAGSVLLEVQQNSNTTYRVFDWGRVGRDGKPRPLHVAEAVENMLWKHDGPTKLKPRRMRKLSGNAVWLVADCPFFRIERLDLTRQFQSRNDGRSFHALFTVRGAVNIGPPALEVRTTAGVSCLMPASVRRYQITPIGGSAQVLRITAGLKPRANSPASHG